MLAFEDSPGSDNCPTKCLDEASAVWHAFHHDFRENFGSVHLNVPSLLASLLDVQTASRQLMFKSIAMYFCGNDDSSPASSESRTDRATQGCYERVVLLIEANHMLANLAVRARRKPPRRSQNAGSHIESPA